MPTINSNKRSILIFIGWVFIMAALHEQPGLDAHDSFLEATVINSFVKMVFGS